MTDRPRFKVMVFPNGHVLVTTEMALTQMQFQAMRDAFREWIDKDHGLLLMAEADTQLAEVEYTPVGDIKIMAPRADEEVLR